MNFKSFAKPFAAVALTSLAIVACKTTGGVSNFVNHISLSQTQQSFDFSTTFAPNIEVSLEGQFPIGNFGDLTFTQDASGNFVIDLSASFNLFGSLNMNPVTTLPNGMAFPSFVDAPLYQVLIKQNPGHYSIYGYFQNPAEASGKRLVGVGMVFDNIANSFPQLTISQNYLNSANQTYATFTVFGPSTINGVQVPGGIFLVGDIHQSVTASPVHGGKMHLSGPDAHKYQSEAGQKQLMEQVRRAFDSNGVRIHGEL